jgi:hypothetical protein
VADLPADSGCEHSEWIGDSQTRGVREAISRPADASIIDRYP